ncbi:hypothetical protein G9F71_008690 [Clostridium sp. FP2]|uniref:hypothetical protein n=1 Tax=Clostridium sp. FP2 TaxID=2724481 RepID=UPI0013E99080|nr:hypothetical protein [Clostridium sp. FP2]MBZ9622930.1 hypothetical protein [Clostridium sp. FP2]
MIIRNIKTDINLIEIAKVDATVQTEDIAEYYLLKSEEFKNMLKKVVSALDDITEEENCGIYDDLIKNARELIYK